MNDAVPADWVVRTTWISLAAALALITLGALAALLPYAVGVAVGMLVVWVVVFAGLAHLVHAWDVRGEMFVWRLSVGLIYLCGGAYLVLAPQFGLIALKHFIGGMFLLESGLLLASSWWMRERAGSMWLALDGAATLVFATLVFTVGGSAAVGVFSLLVGLNVVSSGLVFLVLLRDNNVSLRRAVS